MNIQWRQLLFAGVMAGAWIVPATSQVGPPAITNMVRIHVKPDRVDEFRSIQARFTEARKQAGGKYRGVWRNVNDSYEFVVVTPHDKYAEYDAPPQRSMPEAEFARLGSRFQQCIDSREVTIGDVIQELGIQPTKTPSMVHTIRTAVRPGMVDQYLDLVKEINGFYRKVGLTGYGISRVRLGGSRNTFFSWRAVENMAEFDGPGWAGKALQAMGEEAAQEWIAKYQQVIESAEHDLYRYQKDLSYYPQP
jgi:hypothetical protein